MARVGVEVEGPVEQSFRAHRHAATQALRERRADLANVDDEAVAMPAHRAGADDEASLGARRARCAALRHCPAPWFAIESHVEGAVVFRIALALAAGTGIVRREHAANESDDGQAMASVITRGINIPPAISVSRYRRVEARSCSKASAARMPARAAIGTPGPGCVLPPAR